MIERDIIQLSKSQIAESDMDYFILVTGLMGSGKSAIMDEYERTFPVEKFNKPPIKVFFQGLEFEFIDSTFALRAGENTFNFFELDAPTIQKWVQFIKVSELIIIIHNHAPKNVYGSYLNLRDTVLNNKQKEASILFVLNNFANTDGVVSKMKKLYELEKVEINSYDIMLLPSGETYFDKIYGKRVKFGRNDLRGIFSRSIEQIDNKITKRNKNIDRF